MPEKINEYYSVKYRPYDIEGDGASVLEQACRTFFSSGSASGHVRKIENGQEVHIRYKLSPKRFRWKKTCKGATLQEAFSISGGRFCIVSHDAAGNLLSSTEFDSGLHWQRTACYDGDPKNPTVVLRRCADGIAFRKNGETEEQLLVPCPWEPGTAEQSYVNEIAGEPVVVAQTDAGSFCFCTPEECAKRLELRSKAAAEDGIALGEQAEETLDFEVIPNAVVQVYSRKTKPPVPQKTAVPEAEQKILPQAENRNEYAADHEVFSVPSKRSSVSSKRPARYAVAAKGLSGGIRGGLEPSAPSDRTASAEETPEQKEPEPAKDALIPAKRIVVSSMESYLYFGKLINGLREGRGRTATPDGRTAYEGEYRNDMRDGFGVYYYKSGKLCYAGEWKRNLRNGLGVAFGAKDGSIFVGNWKDGNATGIGSEFDLFGNLSYTGGWKNGRRHGYGTEYRNGKIVRSGIWQNDVFCDEKPAEATQES
jgi:hypothetical protein